MGPGLPRVWPYRLTPDLSGTPKLGQVRRLFQCAFSIARAASIATENLTRPPSGATRHFPDSRHPPPTPSDKRRPGIQREARAIHFEATGALSAGSRHGPADGAYGTRPWLSPKLNGSYNLDGIRKAEIILDLALKGFLESARSRTCRPDRPEPAAEPGESDVTGRSSQASDRQRTNPNEEPTDLSPCATPARSPA